jgi:hypothetical protein
MPAVFAAKGSFGIPSRRLFVISGEILSGLVRNGMTMKVRLNSTLAFDLPISAVEMVKKVDGSEVGLCTVCRDADELSLLKGLNIAGETIEIGDPATDEKRG